MNRIAILFILWISIPFTVFSQTNRHYQFEIALASNNTRCITQDINGNIWIGTTQGITKYDGTNWTSYTIDDGLPNNVINKIYCKNNGDIWVATGGGISKYNGINWVSYTADDGLASNTVWCITEDSDGNIWGGTNNAGIFKFNGTIFTNYSTQQGLINNAVKSIYGDKNGNIWAGTGSGLSKYDGTSFKNYTNANGLGGNLVNDIIQLNNGSIAVATNGGVSIFNFATWQTLNTSNGLPNNNILALAENDMNVLYMGCANGLFEYQNPTTYQLYNFNNGLTDNVVNSVFIDKDGAIWAGSPFSGISYFRKNNPNIIIYKENKHLANNKINHIYKDNLGKIWVSTNNGLNTIDNMHWRTYNTTEGLAYNQITCTFKDNNNILWIGTVMGLSRKASNTTNFNTGNGLTNNHINAICADNNNKIYVATNNKITVFQGSTIIDTISTANGLTHDTIYNVFFDNNNRLWILMKYGLMFYENNILYDADILPSFEMGKPLSISNNSAGGVVVGSDKYLYFFPNGLVGASAIAHPLSSSNSAIKSISELSGTFYCTFENGDFYSYNGSSWSQVPSSYPVSYALIDPTGYSWIGYSNNGLDQICRTCTQNNINVSLSAFTCPNEDYPLTNLTITNPTGVGYQYSINGGNNFQASNVFNNITPGYYHLVVKNSSNIIAYDYKFIDGIGGIDSYLSISQIDCFGNNNAWIELHDVPTSGNFQWNNGNTTDMIRENLSQGLYSVTIQNNIGCKKILSNNIIQPSAILVSSNKQDVLCYGNTTGSIQITPTGGTSPYSIAWSGAYSGFSINNLGAGNYSYTITDNNSCTSNGQIEIVQPSSALSLSGEGEELDCFGDHGNITTNVSGGTAPYSYLWNDGNTNSNRTNVPVGTYSLTITDANNCSVSGSWQITQPASSPSISNINKVDVYCNGASTGSINISVTGGTPPYSYNWTKDSQPFSTNEDLTNLSIGTYSLLVTDNNGCITSTSVTINQSPELHLNIQATPITCPGYNNGSLQANVSGGSGIYSSFYWYNSNNIVIGVNQTISNLGPGTYTISVTDSYYCTITASYTLTEGTGHQIDFVINDASCNGASNGSINVLVNGSSSGNYTYSWSPSIAGNTNTVNNLPAGTYIVTVTDNENCQSSATAIVGQPSLPDLGAFPANGEYRFCSGDELILDAGAGFVSYHWNNGATTQTIPVFNGGSYAVLVRDASGCQYGDTATVIIGEVFQGEKLNLASVNENNKTVLYWEKTPNVGTAYYNIYRKQNNDYILYGTHNANLPAIYIDQNSDAANNSYSYKIASVDTCGNVSSMSDQFSTILLEVHSTQFNQQTICTLNYTPNDGFFVVYYYILKGTSPDNMHVADQNLYNEFSYIEFSPNMEGTYYQIMVRRLDGCYPGDGNYYDTAYSNIVFCQPYTGAITQNINDRINVYPTLFDDYINIDFNLQESCEVHFYLINTLGQAIVFEDKHFIETGSQMVKLYPNVSTGMYMLKMKIGDVWITRKLIKS